MNEEAPLDKISCTHWF